MASKSLEMGASNQAVATKGVLVLVVGPSGAGKDSIINGARSVLKDDARFVFVRRIITRPTDETEDHAECEVDDFHYLKANGAMLFYWTAHGLWYGVPAGAGDELAEGNVVCVNVSRAVVNDVRNRFGNVVTIAIDAPPELLSKRLSYRGRENQTQARKRLDRKVEAFFLRDGDVRIVNDGSLSFAISRFVAVLKSSNPEQNPASAARLAAPVDCPRKQLTK